MGKAIVPIFLFFLFTTGVFANEKIIIAMTENGFEPQEIAVEQSATVTFINRDDVDRWPASNIHPTHGIYPAFDPKRPVKPGESWEFRFNKSGTWKFHDHLLPHMRGTIIVTSSERQEENGLINAVRAFMTELWERLRSIFSFTKSKQSTTHVPQPMSPTFTNLSQAEQFAALDRMINANGLESTWQFIVDTYQNDATNRNAHDLAHFLGTRIFEKKKLDGISICNPSFAFGCYHGFTEAFFTKGNIDKQSLAQATFDVAKACESIGNVGTGPWASCIHGIGHGVGTFFGTTNLKGALSTCDTLTNGQTYCHDGVFMEFATSAPKTVYEKTKLDPLYPCTSVDEKHRQACARQQPIVLEKHFRMSFGEIAATCLKTSDQTIRYYCIDALGLLAGQRSGGNLQFIKSECAKIPSEPSRAQCMGAAAGELVFQNIKGWEGSAPSVCNMLANPFRSACHNRVQQVIKDYRSR